MAKKYHVSDETGVPGVCTAEPGKCPVNRGAGDDETEHYSSPTAAMKGFEDRNKSKEVSTVSKTIKTQKKSAAIVLLEKKRAHLIQAVEKSDDRKYALASVYFDGVKDVTKELPLDEIDAFVSEINSVNKRKAQHQLDLRAIDREIQDIENAEKFDSNTNDEIIARHADKKSMMKKVMKKKRKVTAFKEEHYGADLNEEFNPARFDGADEVGLKKGDCSAVIIANEQGNNASAIYSSMEFYTEPKQELGGSARIILQSDDDYDYWGMEDAARRSGYVVGYVAKDGTRHGYVPDEDIPVYVYK